MHSTWKYPDIPGVDSFEGKLMHSSHWDSSYDLTGKRVAVIGGGSSAVQIIPAIQPKVEKLYLYSRSPAWITAGLGAKYAAPGGVNFDYSAEQKARFQNEPEHLDEYGRAVEGELNQRFTLMHLHSEDQRASRAYVAADMRKKLKDDARLSKSLIPSFALGCRRMTPGSEYLESLTRPNVDVIASSATSITPTGIIDTTGMEVDVIICATGFDVSRPSYEIIGVNGRNLGDEWSNENGPKSYLSVMAEGFPNLFYFIGPNGPASHGSLLPTIEWHTRYMFKVISHIQRTSIRSLSPSRAAVEEAYIHTHQLLKRTAWSSECRSWFKRGKIHGPVTAIWPGSRMHYFEVLKEPRFEDFDIEYCGNRFAYFGNGYTESELDEDANAVWYLDVLNQELEEGATAFWHL